MISEKWEVYNIWNTSDQRTSISFSDVNQIKSPFSFSHLPICFYGNTKISGCYIRPQPTFENHIFHVTKTALSHLRNIAKLRNMLTVSDAEQLVHAFMTSRLDYCNALLGGCPVDLHLHFGNMFQ